MESSQNRGAPQFEILEVLDAQTPHTFCTPAKRINEGPDVSLFLKSKAYRDIGTFVMQLNRAMCPRKSQGEDGQEKILTFQVGSESETQPAGSVRRLQQMLAQIDSLIDGAPPDPGPRRFGNISFRRWYQLLEDKLPILLREYLPQGVLEFGSISGGSNPTAEAELSAYLLGSFGSAQRLDYGTGHELSFLAFLGCLWKLGAFADGQRNEIERNIVLGVFEPYLRVVRRLILTYTLEPAGSHGVWGLDDHSFQPYIYGSAQLTRPINDDEPMPLEGSVARAPKPTLITNAEYVSELRKKNMYFSAVGFINDVKKGPFWEHSPILFDVSGVKDGWGKINKGMIKMFNAEVLSKFPVVQHFPFGSLFSWERDPNAAEPPQSVHMANQPIAVVDHSGRPNGPGGFLGPSARAGGVNPSGAGVPRASGPITGNHGTMRPPPPPPSAGMGTGMPTTRAPWAG